MGTEPRRLLSRSAEGTEALGRALGRELPAGAVLALDGDLGSGKTCFVRGLARGLGVEGPVGSPTYTLMHAYEGGRLPLYHFDAWMEQRERALLADGGGEWLRADGVSVVELPLKPEGSRELSQSLQVIVGGPLGFGVRKKIPKALLGLLGFLKVPEGVQLRQRFVGHRSLPGRRG